MKKILLFLIFSVVLQNCTPLPSNESAQATALKPEKNADGEWELIVIDPQYDSFLASQARPKSMYTEQFLKSKNTFLVQEWNSFYYSQTHRNIIESAIDYTPNENYGFEFEYRLYQIFAMVNAKYGVKFNHLGQMERRY
ncbi:DUF6146 family protein [Frigoriflavimonas asaccharolytica]|uniref:Uncharacterized protein n=1 Tax=Frigoriflavimonas asaccharolytica TaxID=2735899 RepID=A0A8J8G6L2_9FLAO|nr:DUF6146 family protein [Frigoriflavimonas asaccharolytica]NRS92201.1 hypothetical protein [Frigoriflavimonas asaccharolytica]